MSFTSGTYFIFLIAVFFAYWLLANRVRWQTVFLVIAGYYFYAQAGWRALLLLFAVSTIDFAITRFMSHSANRRRRGLLLAVSLTADIGTLCLFKYADFFLASANAGFSAFGIPFSLATLSLLAPIGISFFIFQSVALVIDVYRKDAEPAPSYLEHLAFVSFFPTIIAGPILRGRQLLPQLSGPRTLDAAAGGQALFLIAIGLIKKIAIADYLSANLVDRVFDFPERFSSLEALTAVYGYALQIYADFSGYSDIAIGSALLLGFALPANFKAPYRSRNLPEFWRRWHISLSTWLRDYVFFSIAGPRARRVAALYFGLIVTMLIGGLWHGPAWSFVIWGLLHGIGLCAARAFEGVRKRMGPPKFSAAWSEAAGVFVTFHFVCFAWIFFRADSLAQATGVLRQLAAITADAANLTGAIVLVIALGFAAHWLPDRFFDMAQSSFVKLPAMAQASLLFALAVGLYFVASTDVAPFIYSRF